MEDKITLRYGGIYYASEMPPEFVDDCSSQGDVSIVLIRYAHLFEIENYEEAKGYIRACGVDEEDIGTTDDVLYYLIWLMACDMRESDIGEFIFSH